MGYPMSGHLLKAGHTLRIYNRTRARAEGLLLQGAVWCDSPAAVAQNSQIIFTMLGYPRDVEAVYLGPNGLVKSAKPGSVLVDMTTSSPLLAQRIAEAADARGVAALDAPVTGGDKGAREATLTILVGGDPTAFARVQPLLSCLGRNIVHLGGPGSGQHAKLANQIAIAGAIQGVCESLAYARAAELDPSRVLSAISGGAAASWQLLNLGPKMLAGDDAPGFYAKHFVKDLELALVGAKESGLDIPAAQLALRRYRQMLQSPESGDRGTQALFHEYDTDVSQKT